MYQAYLVDDEPLALRHMLETIPWHENEFEVIGSSTHPLVALGEVMALEPDVLFVDIHMSPITGLELIARLREAKVELLCVVVSAYDHFEYARSIIQMQGFDYLIKPVEMVQYLDLFTRLSARLGKDHPQKEARQPTASSDLNMILTYLKENFAQKQSLNQISKLFSISPNYICRLFSKHFSTTFSAHLARLRMEHAAGLLSGTEKAVKEISALSGYDDYFYFCRVFRDMYGQTPTQFRRGT